MNHTVLAILEKKTDIEKQQLQNHCFINDMPSAAIDKSQTKKITVLNNTYFFKSRSVYISKHNRFAPYPAHTHEFLELNYMLSGSCTQIVDGQKITLHQGDILMMNIGCSHSIGKLGNDDLLINILFKNQSISFKFIDEIKRSKSITFSFLASISAQSDNDGLSFILFPQNLDMQRTLNELITEYYLDKFNSKPIVESYLRILLAKMVRYYPYQNTHIEDNFERKLTTEILTDIEKEYRTITLGELSKRYGYNKNYISSLIKNLTGQNFIDLRTKQRLIQAQYLLTSSDISIQEISSYVGFSNKNSFYKKYKERYGQLPSACRETIKDTEHF